MGAVPYRHQRRNQLLGKIAADRRRLRDAMAPLNQPLALVDLGWSMTRLLTRHPFAVASACAALSAVLPRWLGRWWTVGPLIWRLATVFRSR